MPIRIVYGNIDFPYGHAYGEDTVDPNITTAEVATKLEKRYHIYKTFHKRHRDEIVGPIAGQLSDLFVAASMGQNVNIGTALRQTTSHIAPLFHKFLDNREMDGLAGIPTQRSLDGVSHRRKKRVVRKKARTISRPSFEDSLLYRNKTKIWLDIDL